MSVIYSEVFEDYFLTNMRDNIFADDDEEDSNNDDSLPVTEFTIRNCPNSPVDKLLLEHSTCSSVDLVGLQLWRGALLLADFILAHPDQFRGANILELAAGTGLTSVVSAMFGSSVTATDVDRGDILPLIRRNFQLNNESVKACDNKILELDFFWDDFPKDILDNCSICDIILAADVVYDKNITFHFFKTLKKILSMSSKTAYIAIEKRKHAGTGGEIVAPNYKIFLDQLSQLENSPLNAKLQVNVTNIPLDFGQYFNYSRVSELNLFKINSYESK